MIALKGMEPQTDCQKCPFMATDGTDTLLSPMMCIALWATKHEVKHCTKEKILDDCPLVEVVSAYAGIDGARVVYYDEFFCSSGERRKE